MEFAWRETDIELYDRTLVFSRALACGDGSSHTSGEFPRAAWRECGHFGLLGLCAPEEHGGMGLGALSTARAMEAFGRGCLDTGFVFSVAAHLFACVTPIVEFGSRELKHRVLPRLCDGTWIGANAITEAEAGSDAFALTCRAQPDAGGYILDGTKSYVTNGPIADAMVVYASTKPEHGYLGITGFAVDTTTAGIRAGRPFDKIGLETSPTSAVYLEGCRVPADAVLGEVGQGAQVFQTSMAWERACLFAAYLGVMERLIEQSVAWARERRQFGKRIGRYQAVSHKIAEMKLRLEGSRLLLYRACWLFDQGADATLEISLAKVAVSEAAVQTGLDAIQIHGGLGIAREGNIERALRDAIPSTIFSGTSEIQRNLIARALGL